MSLDTIDFVCRNHISLIDLSALKLQIRNEFAKAFLYFILVIIQPSAFPFQLIS